MFTRVDLILKLTFWWSTKQFDKLQPQLIWLLPFTLYARLFKINLGKFFFEWFQLLWSISWKGTVRSPHHDMIEMFYSTKAHQFYRMVWSISCCNDFKINSPGLLFSIHLQPLKVRLAALLSLPPARHFSFKRFWKKNIWQSVFICQT